MGQPNATKCALRIILVTHNARCINSCSLLPLLRISRPRRAASRGPWPLSSWPGGTGGRPRGPVPFAALLLPGLSRPPFSRGGIAPRGGSKTSCHKSLSRFMHGPWPAGGGTDWSINETAARRAGLQQDRDPLSCATQPPRRLADDKLLSRSPAPLSDGAIMTPLFLSS